MPMNTTLPSRRSSSRAAGGPHHLLDDLAGRQLAPEPGLLVARSRTLGAAAWLDTHTVVRSR